VITTTAAAAATTTTATTAAAAATTTATKTHTAMAVVVVGMYAVDLLVHKLPSPVAQSELMLSDDTVAAVESALYEIIKTNSTHARYLCLSLSVLFVRQLCWEQVWFLVASVITVICF